MTTPTTPTLRSGYPSQDAIARAGAYLARPDAHTDRAHVRQGGRLYSVTPAGGRIGCDRPECIERYPECGRVVCSGGTNVATHRLRTASGFVAYLCDEDTGWMIEWSRDPVELLECLDDTAHAAAAMPLECTCRKDATR